MVQRVLLSKNQVQATESFFTGASDSVRFQADDTSRAIRLLLTRQLVVEEGLPRPAAKTMSVRAQLGRDRRFVATEASP